MRRMWIVWLAVAPLIGMVYFVVPDSPESKLVLYNGTGLLAVLSILYGIRRNRPTDRRPWFWFAAGLGSFLTADILYYLLELLPGDTPFPSVADLFYLGMYPLVIIGLTLLLRNVSHGRDSASFLDAAVVGTAMFGALWVLFVDMVWDSSENTTAALVTQLAYPVMDVALFTVAARLVVKVHLRHPPFAFLLAAMASLAVADTAYGIANAEGNFQTGTYIDAFWLGFYTLFGAAALHPAMSERGRFVETVDGRLTGRQLAIMFVAPLSVPAIDLLWGTEQDRPVTITVSALQILLILVRVFALTKALEVGRDRMHHEATHDSLTGLANRTLFAERTHVALEAAVGRPVAVLFIDLDDFKTINDSLGHQAGDKLLTELAARLAESVRPGDTVARLGGDEFAVLLESVVDRNDIISVAQRILDALSEPVDVGPRVVQARCSIGVAMASGAEGDCPDVDILLRNADVAMYLSKSRGKARFEFFEPEMHAEAIERLDLKADLQAALKEQQFVLHYQPIFDLKTGRVVLTEALVRWRHPKRGLIGPDKFIPLAEESGLIVPLGAWVLQQACAQAAKWQRMRDCDDIGVTVNLSMRQLHDHELLNTLTAALRNSGLSASNLVLEITESMLAVDAARTTSLLEQLKTIGVKLAIDDFGTGYSSLSYLRSFPVDSIKIDRSFISEINVNPTAPALIEAVVNLSQALGAYTVAEGIEHEDHAKVLRRLGCDRGQGYLYCRPLPPAALTDLLRAHGSRETEPLEAWRRESELAQEKLFDSDVHSGLEAVVRMGPAYDTLARTVGVPLMGSWRWLHAWCDTHPDWTPFMVTVCRGDSGVLQGAALLASRKRGDATSIVAVGHNGSLCTQLPAVDSESAAALANAIKTALDDIAGVWSLEIEQLPDLDPTMGFLANYLENVQVLPDLRIPRVQFSAGVRLDTILSKNTRKQLRRARNRISEEGLTLTIGFDRGDAITSDLIDEVEAVHVSRDRAQRRASDLDRPAEREFWRNVVSSKEWDVEVASLRLDGELAAYVVALLDGDSYRVFDGRMSSEFQDYSPGRIVESAALDRALADPRFTILDWMSGVAAEKLLVANVAEGRARLVATSGTKAFTRAKQPKVVASR